MSTLDLSGADFGIFDLVDSGRYDAHIDSFETTETENEDGNLPVGTPGYVVRFVIDGGKFDNRGVFSRYYIAPEDYPKKKFMDSMFAGFLMAIGYSQKEITSGKFKIDPDDVVGRKCSIVVGKTKDGEYNKISRVNPLGQNASDAGLL